MTKTQAILALREAQLQAGHRVNTRKTYQHWLVRYITAVESGQATDIQSFFDLLSSGPQRVNPKTVKQALNAMVFFEKNVLKREPGTYRVPKVNPHRNQPTWLSHSEMVELIARLTGTRRLQVELLYGTGSRINAMLTLRLKDIDLGSGLVTFRDDKGGKSRTVRLPAVIIPKLAEHIDRVRRLWQTDHAQGIIAPSPEPSLMRKLSRKTFGTLPWYWLFPSAQVRSGERWHATSDHLAKAVAKASIGAGITKRVTLHTIRHSNATALLQRGVDIRTIQEHLGHTHVETTEIYTHATGSHAVISPLDAPPVAQPALIASPAIIPFHRSA